MRTKTKIERVTPAMAEQWLRELNPRNRHVITAAVVALVKDLKEGRWVTSHQGIAFGEDGQIYDGQHRLSAIMLSGVTVDIMVTRGLGAEVRPFIDNGGAGRRSPTDVLAITHDIHMSSSVRAWINWAENLLEIGPTIGQWPKLTPHVLLRGWERQEEHVKAIVLTLGEKTSKISRAPVAAAFIIAHKLHPHLVEALAIKVATGVDLHAGDPALALRNRLLMGAQDASPAGRDDINSTAFGTIEAFVKGVELKVARRNDGARDRILAAWKK